MADGSSGTEDRPRKESDSEEVKSPVAKRVLDKDKGK